MRVDSGNINGGHVWGEVTVQHNTTTWTLHVDDIAKDGRRVAAKINVDIALHRDHDEQSQWVGNQPPVTWTGEYHHSDTRGVRVYVCREGVRCDEFVYVHET